jgi:hypothetical protein
MPCVEGCEGGSDQKSGGAPGASAQGNAKQSLSVAVRILATFTG